MNNGVERFKRFILGDPLPPVDPAMREMLDDAEWRDGIRGVVADHTQRRQALRHPKRKLRERLRVVGDNIAIIMIVGGLLVLASATEVEPAQEKPLTQQEFLDLRETVLTDPDILSALGYCATELWAQQAYDTSRSMIMGASEAYTTAVQAEQDKVARHLAMIYGVSCDAQELSVTVQSKTRGMQEVFPETFVAYDKTLWCSQRLAAVNSLQVSAQNRLEYVADGDRVFGSQGGYCPGAPQNN